MFCKHCGAKVEDHAHFCTSCGSRLQEDTPPSGDGPSSYSYHTEPPPEGQQQATGGGAQSPLGLSPENQQLLFKIVATAAAAFFALQVIGGVLSIPRYIQMFFYMRFGMILSLATLALGIAGNAITAVCCGLLGWKRTEKNRTTLFLGICLGILLMVAVSLLTTIQTCLIGFGIRIVFAFFWHVVAAVILYLLLYYMGEKPFDKDFEKVKADAKAGFDDLRSQADGYRKKEHTQTSYSYNATYTSGNHQTTYHYEATYQGGTRMPLKTDRNIVMYILLSIITCGIYSYYTIYTLAKDMNELAREDGQTTPGLLMFILLSFVTCGLYSVYWLYCLANRQAAIAPRYGLNIQENGTTILLWYLIGFLLCGIGPIVAMYFIFRNMNALCAEYNRGLNAF